MSIESIYNEGLTTESLLRVEAINPSDYNLITYSKPRDTCQGREILLANMTGGFPFQALGRTFKSVEHLYLLGEWSLEGDHFKAIQEDVLTATSGYAAKRFKKTKYKKEIRKDYPTFRHHWMLWCVWQKCLGNEDFRKHLLSIPKDNLIVEVVKNDPVWAAWPDKNGILRGANAMGKILTICANCLRNQTTPTIDLDLLNKVGIYILGERVHFN